MNKTIKTPLSVIQPSVFSDYFLLIHLQIGHKISNTLLYIMCRFNETSHHTNTEKLQYSALQLECTVYIIFKTQTTTNHNAL